MVEFDLFNGGFSQFDSYIEKMKNELTTLNDEIVVKGLEVAEKIVRNRASVIEYPKVRQEFQNRNEKRILQLGRKAKGVLVNTSQDATYAEYGTGFIGSNNPYIYGEPYPGEFLGYNAPSEHKKVDKSGITFWFYDGTPNYGMPSYHVMYSSSKDLERQMPNIIGKLMKGRFDK